MANKKELEQMPVTEVISWQEYNERKATVSGRGFGGGTAIIPTLAMLQQNVDRISGKPTYEGVIIPKLINEQRVDVIYNSEYVADYFVNLFGQINAITIDEDSAEVQFTPIWDRFFDKQEGTVAKFAKTIISRKAIEEESKKARIFMSQFPGMSLEQAIELVRAAKKAASANTTQTTATSSDAEVLTVHANGKERVKTASK
jgi:ribosomal protein L12E/L44/L45/RPP1/RPP2